RGPGHRVGRRTPGERAIPAGAGAFGEERDRGLRPGAEAGRLGARGPLMPAAHRRQALLDAADAAAPTFRELALRLHAHPEVGLEERQAAAWISEALETASFDVERGVAELPTAFVAGRGHTSARPVIAFLAEYDALPELGHACGHNLIASAAGLAAVALAGALAPGEAQVRVIG